MANDPATVPRRVCLLTGGGDAPGTNAIVRAFFHAARNFSLEVLGARYGFEGLLDPEGITPVTLREIQGILPRGGSVLGCSTRVNPFYVAVDGTPPRDMSPVIVDHLRMRGIEALILVGGDGTTRAAERFASLGLNVLGIPKTIDNDLAGTDATCGFDSAVTSATQAIDALHSTAEAHARVMLVEVMGRNAGWIALHAGVAGGADVVLIPEIPYRLEPIIAKIRERDALGLRFSLIVVAEGARPVDGSAPVVERERPGHLARLGGAGSRLLAELEAARLPHEVRLTVLGHLQRGGSPSAFDRNFGTELGTYAAELCRDRAYGRRVVLHAGQLTSLALTPRAHADERATWKQVDLDGALVSAARLVGTELGDGPTPAVGLVAGPAHCETAVRHFP